MSRHSEFFLNARSSVVQLELLEISHPAFTRAYRIVRNAIAGVTVTLEDSTSATFDYYPLRISPMAAKDDLDAGFSIQLGDLGQVLPVELDAVAEADGFATKPIVKYRVYRSDDLTAPILGPLVLEVVTFSFTREVSSFEARAPRFNLNRTGELYRVERFPMLRSTL
ncbi:MAG: DUF1833 family protein [Deltaproteobacteria bacterium]